MFRVTSARIVLADYELLRKDFPELRELNHPDIDEWLLEHAAFVSKPQAAQTIVNTPIAVRSDERIAYRPKDYRRAAVFKAGTHGLIDAKGTGSLNPFQGDHGNGLATVGEAIREFAYEKLVDKIFEHSQTGLETIGTYAVIDYGFNVRHADESISPAGAVLRQAHPLYPRYGSLFNERRSTVIEKVLRRYGITSAGAYHDEPKERINLQGSQEGAVLDFGGFVAVEDFDKRAIHFYGYRTLLKPGTPDFVQPDPAVRVPLEQWGFSAGGKIDPKLDHPWIWSHELAAHLRDGTATRADVERHIRNLLEPVAKRLSAHPLSQAAMKNAAKFRCANLFDKITNLFGK